MKILPLLALSLAGCSLYLGSDDPALTSPTKSSLTDEESSCGDSEVHVIGVYETHGDQHGEYHPPGDAQVTVNRPGNIALVLSAYEPVNWQVSLGEGVTIKSVTLIGYYDQTVNLTNVPVNHGQACGYSYPYNGGGCDTDEMLAKATELAGGEVTTFHGCYQASSWTLNADGTAESNCSGSESYELRDSCTGDGDDDGGGGDDPGEPITWSQTEFTTISPPPCSGERFLRYDARYKVFVGAILCGDAEHYKLYMSDRSDQPFAEIADYGGHGQDHCELVNRAFRITNDDDITSGGCTSCSVGDSIDIIDVPVYARDKFGKAFKRVTARFWADLTTNEYSCGVSIP